MLDWIPRFVGPDFVVMPEQVIRIQTEYKDSLYYSAGMVSFAMNGFTCGMVAYGEET